MKWHKYNAVKTEVDGIVFDSRREAARYGELKMMQKAGVISGLGLQPEYTLQDTFFYTEGGKKKRCNAIKYRPDFVYVEGGQQVAEDVKGFETEAFRIKAKLFRKRYPEYELRITK